MAAKTTLIGAIETLKHLNAMLIRKMKESSSEKEKEELSNKISRNESLILDYDFRLHNE